MRVRDSITRLKMYYVCTFESFVFTYARVIIFLHLANVRMYITVYAVTTYIPNVGLSLRYNFHAIRVLSATSRNSQTTYNRPRPPSLPARISGAERAFEDGDGEGKGREKGRENKRNGEKRNSNEEKRVRGREQSH